MNYTIHYQFMNPIYVNLLEIKINATLGNRYNSYTTKYYHKKSKLIKHVKLDHYMLL